MLPVLPLLVANAALCLPLALLFELAAPGPAAAHLAFAAAALPLILAAMGYFIPVLTRGAPPPPLLRRLPLAAAAAGAIAVAALAGSLPYPALVPAAALAAATALFMRLWMRHRQRGMVGAPHPGLAWYGAALLFLLAALAAIPAMQWWPEQRAAWRLWHLHANLLGFVGLTAIGTLQVLLPTCLGTADPAAAGRLRRDLPLAVAGVTLVAAGAARWPAAASAGALLLTLVLLRFLLDSWRRHRRALWPAHGAAAALTAASLGLLALLALGVAHGHGLLPGRPAVPGFILAVLLPLVSGAASQLLPVWLRPGPQTAWHGTLRQRLTRGSGWRGALLLGAGLAVTLGIATPR